MNIALLPSNCELSFWASTPEWFGLFKDTPEPPRSRILRFKNRNATNAYKAQWRATRPGQRAKDRELNKCWRARNVEKLREYSARYNKEYYKDNKEKFSTYNKEYQSANRQAIKRQKHEKYLSQRPELLLARRVWRRENKEKVAKWNRLARLNMRLRNPEKLKEISKRKRAKIKADPLRKLAMGIRGRICSMFRRGLNGAKCASSLELLGCSFSDAKAHLEKQFKAGMSWENWSLFGWHIDHITPLSSFDLSKPEEQKKAFHYSNLQPLWAEENLKKGAIYPL